MSKLLFLLLLSASLSPSLNAQQGVYIGLGIIPQNTWMFNQRDIIPERTGFTYEATFNYAAAFTIGWNINGAVGIQSGLIYSRQGQSHHAFSPNGERIDVSRSLAYAKIPLLLHVNTGTGKKGVSFGFGPYFGILGDASYTETGEEPLVIDPGRQMYKALDVGIAWDFGGDFFMSRRMSFNVHLRGDYSFGDIENKSLRVNGSAFYDSFRQKTQNATFGVLFGLSYFITKKKKYYCSTSHVANTVCQAENNH